MPPHQKINVKVQNLEYDKLEDAYTFDTMAGKQRWWPAIALHIIERVDKGVSIISVRKDFAERNGLL